MPLHRLIDCFRNHLEDILTLSFPGHIFILSKTFESHLSDLQCVFDRLILFKLQANREMFCFESSKVKCLLSFWITQTGIESQTEKIASLQSIHLKSVKEIQSILHTVSGLEGTTKIPRLLNDLIKIKSLWTLY
ncbi:hypothetical protein CDAR_249261 [Caerostris darwini]|uniref:Maturase K n=1 Tax=Caerostris darwini TaxID=1538125 RepID=A0AAV4TFE5_9ARAC|nr:hypothetical protein CDAR_249261 [Caerostris darwini]